MFVGLIKHSKSTSLLSSGAYLNLWTVRRGAELRALRLMALQAFQICKLHRVCYVKCTQNETLGCGSCAW